MPRELSLATAAAARCWGRRLGGLLRAGDLVLLTGELGAGKTTLAQGIGDGLRVRGPITSPTFVLARVHPSLADGPALVHVDAYRLDSLAEIEDLDLDASLDDAVTVVEWGSGLVEALSPSRLEIVIGGRGVRRLVVHAIGPRWAAREAGDGLDAMCSLP